MATFIDPSVEKIYKTLVNNDDLITYLKKENLLLTKAALYEDYAPEKVKDMSLQIYVSNVNTLYELAQVLLNYSDEIKENDVWYLLSNKIGWDEIANALGVESSVLEPYAYKMIVFTYKHCVVSSFFQNNKSIFMPENDYTQIKSNGAAHAFYDALMKEFDKLDVVLSGCKKFMSFDDIPYEYINYLSQLLGFEKSDILADSDTEAKYRELCKNILDIYRIKGTNYSFELFFNFLGFSVEIKEYYFDRRLYYNLKSANSETDSSDNEKYEYFLTVNNPIDNQLNDIGISEIVSSADITKQYSLQEFNDLCKEYGVEVVLGYSPIYPVYNSNGDLLEYKEYTGKVYKYFKTNAIYYNVSMDGKNPTEKEISMISKILEFLTPSYVLRKISVETYEEKEKEPIAFDGDGSDITDAYGNYSSFQMLDGEDWSQHYKNKYVTSDSTAKVVDENNYEGKEEAYKAYTNSLGTNTFRTPVGGHRFVNKSVSRYLTGGEGVALPVARRLKYYIYRTKNGAETGDYDDTVTFTPYYTVPPYIGSNNYVTMKNLWEKETEVCNLTGSEDSVKNKIKDAGLRTKIDFVTDKSIEEYKEDDEFSELAITETFSKKLTLLRSISYGSGTYTGEKAAYKAYLYEFNQNKIHICNMPFDFSLFDEALDNNYSESNIAAFSNSIYNNNDIENYYKNGVLKNLSFGDYVLAYDGTLSRGTLKLYRYGYTSYPIKADSNNYSKNYLNYIKSFDYSLEKAYNGSIKIHSEYDSVNLSVNYTTFKTLKEAANYIAEARKNMLSSSDYGLDYITSKLFYISSEDEYYIAVKKPAASGICYYTYESGKNHVFSTMAEAGAYFSENHTEKINNAEFYVSSTNKLYTYCYTNRKKGTLVYSTKDETLYYVAGSSSEDVLKLKNFYGNLVINEDGTGYIDKYDEYWKGYDEVADSEDFIFYNAAHKITWNNLSISNTVIDRPIRRETDIDFDKDSANNTKVYESGDDISKYKLVNGFPTYYKTAGQNIVGEICENTVDCFTDFEKLNWLDGDYNHAKGLLSVIENNIEDLLGITHNEELVYYSDINTFLQDYYRMIVLENYKRTSIPKGILETYFGKAYGDITEEDVDADTEFHTNIATYYKNTIKEIKDILDNISKDRVYYYKIYNWRSLIFDKVQNWEVKPENPDTVYKDPFNNTYGPKIKDCVNDCYYYTQKTTFLKTLLSCKEKIENLFGSYINFDVDKDLLGKDCYSYNCADKEGYSYSYVELSKTKTISLGDSTLQICRDDNYDFFIAFSLNYSEDEYSIDTYNEHRDTYSQFKELINAFDGETVEDYLKTYYYKKLVSLYRESYIKDENALGIESYGKSPMKAYPKLAETFNGKAGSFGSTGTLLSSYRNNGSEADDLKMNFSDFKFESSDNCYVLKLYITRENFIKTFGYDFNRYYRYSENANYSADFIQETEELYKKQFSCISPRFLYEDKNLYKTRGVDYLTDFTNWQKLKPSLEADFTVESVDTVDANNYSITDTTGHAIDTNKNIIVDSVAIKERIAETDKLILTIDVSDYVTTNNVPFTDVFTSFKEKENIYGFLIVKKLKQSFNENYLSKSYYNDWIEKDSEGEATEYTSFGDDRTINAIITNRLLDNEKIAEELFSTRATTTNKTDTVENPQYDKYGRVLDVDGTYKQFSPKKAFEDQGINPEYKKEESEVVLNSDGDKALVTKVEIDGQIYNVENDDISFEYDENNKVNMLVTPGFLNLNKIKTIKLYFALLFTTIKKQFINAIGIVKCSARFGKQLSAINNTAGLKVYLNNYLNKLLSARLKSFTDILSNLRIGRNLKFLIKGTADILSNLRIGRNLKFLIKGTADILSNLRIGRNLKLANLKVKRSFAGIFKTIASTPLIQFVNKSFITKPKIKAIKSFSPIVLGKNLHNIINHTLHIVNNCINEIRAYTVKPLIVAIKNFTAAKSLKIKLQSKSKIVEITTTYTYYYLKKYDVDGFAYYDYISDIKEIYPNPDDTSYCVKSYISVDGETSYLEHEEQIVTIETNEQKEWVEGQVVDFYKGGDPVITEDYNYTSEIVAGLGKANSFIEQVMTKIMLSFTAFTKGKVIALNNFVTTSANATANRLVSNSGNAEFTTSANATANRLVSNSGNAEFITSANATVVTS